MQSSRQLPLLQKAHLNARSLALNAEIYEKDVIGLLLAKANRQALGLDAVVGPKIASGEKPTEAATPAEAPNEEKTPEAGAQA